jgi:Icc-related predicted phosphoesterase
MKLLSYSDLHLEFGVGFQPPADRAGDVLILAGDIITFTDYSPLSRLLAQWTKPVLFIAGNHEYYRSAPIEEADADFKRWLAERHSNVTFLQDEAVTIGGVQFFGGTMWTDFDSANPRAMREARDRMNDYRYIQTGPRQPLEPADTVAMHKRFVEKLLAWFDTPLPGPRVVISHHAPVVNPQSRFGASTLMPAFNSLDMLPIIQKHHPHLWVYGHTHECDDQVISGTRIISNQRGYPNRNGEFECEGFDVGGRLAIVN